MAEFCRIVYRQGHNEGFAEIRTLRELLAESRLGWEEVHFIDALQPGWPRRRRFWRPALPAEDTQAALLRCQDPRCLVLVFRGTLGPKNVLTDLAFLAWPLRLKTPASVHWGFQAALDTVWPRILALLRTTPGEIFLTGHSLGGALATLAAARLRQHPRFRSRVAGLYTLGSPRVGTTGFGASLEGVYHARIVHGDDPIAKVPPAFSLPGFPVYRHTGWRHTVYSSGLLDAATAAEEDVASERAGLFEVRDLLLDALRRFRAGAFFELTRPLRDHTPLLYTRALYALWQRGAGGKE